MIVVKKGHHFLDFYIDLNRNSIKEYNEYLIALGEKKIIKN